MSIAGITIALAGTIMAQDNAADLAKAERSFSKIPFGTDLVKSGLTPRDPACRISDCPYVDANKVWHVGGQSNELAIKGVDIADVGQASISAFGIGKARLERDVMRNVRAFMPRVQFDCGGDEGQRGDVTTSCGASMGEGSVKLLFDAEHKLKTVRIDAYQIN